MNITETIFQTFFNVILWGINLLPSLSITTPITDAISSFATYFATIGYFFPLPLSAAILVFVATYMTFKLLFLNANYWIHYIPWIRPNR